MRNCRSKSVNFSLFHYRDTPPRPLGWYFPPLWLTSRYPRHDQKHHSTCGRPCSGIKVRVLGPQTSVADISQCKRQRSPSCSKFIIFIAVLAQYLPSGITCKQYRRRQTRFRWREYSNTRARKSNRNSGIPESARTLPNGTSC